MPDAEPVKRLLFVCNENCNRSQMAEAFAHIFGGERVEAYSAGCHPAEAVHPKAITAMQELGYDMHGHYPKGLSAVPDIEFDVTVTMGCDEGCSLPKARHREDWSIPVPKWMPADQFKGVRDEIRDRVKVLLAGIGIGFTSSRQATPTRGGWTGS